MTERQMRNFSEDYFGEHGGYAQQYLFHHARKTSRKSTVARDSSTALRSARNDKEGKARKTSRKSTVARDSSTALPHSTPALRACAQGDGLIKQGSGACPGRSRRTRNHKKGRPRKILKARKGVGHDQRAKVGNEKGRGLSEVGG
jgi:hypothetical protein